MAGGPSMVVPTSLSFLACEVNVRKTFAMQSDT